jgi:hypothetical protein
VWSGGANYRKGTAICPTVVPSLKAMREAGGTSVRVARYAAATAALTVAAAIIGMVITIIG